MTDAPTTHEIDPLADPRWDAYVRQHPRGSLYHLGAWARILARSYGFEPRYVALEQSGAFVGLLPLFRKKGIVSEARMRSIPVFAYGGPLADDDQLERRLIEAARDLAAESGVAGLSINTDDRRIEPPAGFAEAELEPRWMLDVPAPGDLDAFRTSLRKTSRNLFRSLRKADDAGLEFRESRSPRDLRTFHRLYVEAMRSHRSLPRSLRQVRLTQELLGDAFRLFVVSHQGRDVAAAVYHVFGDTAEAVYIGSEQDALQLRPNHALYWGGLRWASEHGLRRVNFGGATPGTQLGDFKRQWGAVPCSRYRLAFPAQGGHTRTEALVSVSYGAEGSERRLTEIAWRYMPAPLLRLGAYVAYRYA
jgi:CelD/BcsL family acetyltransferase involved in cellulose biosynthesis